MECCHLCLRQLGIVELQNCFICRHGGTSNVAMSFCRLVNHTCFLQNITDVLLQFGVEAVAGFNFNDYWNAVALDMIATAGSSASPAGGTECLGGQLPGVQVRVFYYRDVPRGCTHVNTDVWTAVVVRILLEL